MEECPGNINNFCYVCGHFVPMSVKKGSFSAEIKTAYQKYFNQQLFLDVDWTPNIVCRTCYTYLWEWMNKKRAVLPFGVPMIWTDPIEHDPSNCYACANRHAGLNRKKVKSVVYVGVPSAQLPLPHSDSVPIPNFPSPDLLSQITADFTESSSAYPLFEPEMPTDEPTDEPTLLTQDDMDFLVAKLSLSQRSSEFLTSFLKKKKLVEKTVRVKSYRSRQAELQEFYIVDSQNTLAYCIDIEQLMNKIGIRIQKRRLAIIH